MLNHIAFLVSSVERSAEVFRRLGCPVGAREVWEGEGTAEIYVGDDAQSARVLLMEPILPGAYDRAMKKRGSGLHHIAIDVQDLEGFVSDLSGSGWYLHPMSVRTMPKTRTAWLARPGTPLLVEVQERIEVRPAGPFVTRLELPLTTKEQSMMTALLVTAVVTTSNGEACLYLNDRVVPVREILS